MWAAIGSVVLGALGWAGAHLLFEPLKEIMDLRRQAQESLIVYGGLPPDAAPDDRHLAAESFRRVGAGLISRHIAAFPWVRWFCGYCLGWDIHSAGSILVGIGLTTQSEGFSNASASPVVPLIRAALKLPTPSQPPIVRELMAHASRPAPIEPGDL